jgi:hypothetical protein
MLLGKSRATYYTKSDKLPKKYSNVSVLKKFGKNKWYWIDKATNKKIIKKESKDTFWNFNGQGMYTGNIHWTLRSKIVNYYHKLFIQSIHKHIKDTIPSYLGYSLSISVDIYEIFSKNTPDIGNVGWLLLKLFEDSLQLAAVIRNDSPEYIMESGRSRYHWVKEDKQRKLVFKIKYIKV